MVASEMMKRYGIWFAEDVSPDASWSTKVFLGGGEMEIFFFFWRNPGDIEEDILPVIDHHLNGNPFPIDDDLSVEGNKVWVQNGEVQFIDRNTGAVEQAVPLADFRIIAREWADYNRKRF